MPITKALHGVFSSEALKNFYFFFDRILVCFNSLDNRVQKCSDLPAHTLLYVATYKGIALLANLTLGKSCMASYSAYVHIP